MSRVGAALGETRTSLATVFRNPGLRNINLAFAGSAIGDWAYATAIVVWAYGQGGLTLVGLWGTIRLLLMAVVTPFASTLVDRLPRKMVMISTDLIRGALVLLVAFLILIDFNYVVILVLGTVTALVAAPFRPAVAALLPSLVEEPEELTAANGAGSTIESLAFFVGPALGGLMLTIWSAPAVIVFDGLTFAWSAFLVSRIHVPQRHLQTGLDAEAVAAVDPADADDVAGQGVLAVATAEDKKTEGFLAESMAGFRAILADKDLRLVSGVYCAQTIVAGASIVYTVEMAVQMTSFGAQGVGYMDSVLGIGAILGGLVAIGRASKQRIATDFGWGVVFWAIPLVIAALGNAMWAALAAVLIIGFANPIVDVNASTILQRLTPDNVLGRVFGALDGALIGAMALGSIIYPLLFNWVGLRWSLAILGVAVTALVLPTFGRLRRLDAMLGASAELELLSQIPLFGPLEPKSLEDVARQLKRREVRAGEAVITEGDVGDRFYIVEFGRTTATHGGQVLSSQGPGDPFGEIALLRDVPRTATVTADEDSVLLYLERDEFLAAVTGNSEVAGRADDLIARRIPTY
ncbi:MAG TPA: MFS transporter [Candidatus Nanopelagicales bacterium]|nr:MFS transporter [Candidatus Nanopelagicales bacterium]